MKTLISVTTAILFLLTVLYGHDNEHIPTKSIIFKQLKTKKDQHER